MKGPEISPYIEKHPFIKSEMNSPQKFSPSNYWGSFTKNHSCSRNSKQVLFVFAMTLIKRKKRKNWSFLFCGQTFLPKTGDCPISLWFLRFGGRGGGGAEDISINKQNCLGINTYDAHKFHWLFDIMTFVVSKFSPAPRWYTQR